MSHNEHRGRTIMQLPDSLSERSDPALHGNRDVRDVNAYVIDRTVGLVRTTDDQFVGTGTLVSIGDQHGILTARHVMKCFRSGIPMGVAMPSPFDLQVHRLEVPLSRDQLCYAEPISTGRADEQPDIGIVILPQHYASILLAKKSFYNLTKHGPKVLESPPDCGRPIWVLAGTPDEWSRDGEPERAFDSMREFTLMLGFGVVGVSSHYIDFNCLEFKVDWPTGSQVIRSFGGCSGGGLWHIPMTNSKALLVDKAQLMGVAFRQACISSHKNTIYCVGSKVIYKHMIDIVTK